MKPRHILHKIILVTLFLLPGLVIVEQVLANVPASTILAQETPTAIVATGRLNVRTGPSISYSIVTTLNQGQVVTLIGRNADSSWAKIRLTDGREGWVSAPLIQPSVAISTLPLADAAAPAPSAIVATAALNMRSGPSVAYGRITQLSYGQSVTLIGRLSDNSWVKIRLADGREGWVNSGYLQANVDIPSLPVLDAPGAPPSLDTGVSTTLRAGPGSNYESLGQIFSGQDVNLIGRNNNSSWVKLRVLSDGRVGWVRASAVRSSLPVSSLDIVDGTAPEVSGNNAVVTSARLNIRTGPGTSYDIITTVNQGQTMALIGRNGDSSWAKIRLGDGREGWVNASLIQPGVAINTLPVVEGTAAPPPAVANGASTQLRAGPGSSYSSLGPVYSGQNVILIGRNNNSTWVKIRVLDDGREGWVFASAILSNLDISGLPIVDGSVPIVTGNSAVVTSATLNMRTGPAIGFPVITTLNQGQSVALIGRNADASWAKIRLEDGREGWVNASLIQPGVPISSLPLIEELGSTPGATAVITTGALNVRTGPDIAYESVGTVYQGQTVSLLGRNSNSVWAKIRTAAGLEGWINTTLTRPSIPISSLPLIEVPPPTPRATIATGTANIRSGPDIAFSSVATANEGVIVLMLGRNNNSSWIYVQLPDGREGWVNVTLIEPNVPVSGLPVR